MGTGDLQELSRFSDSNCKAPGISDNAKFAGVDDRKGWELWLFYDREQLTPVVGNIDPDTQIDPQVALQPDILQTKSNLQAISQCFIHLFYYRDRIFLVISWVYDQDSKQYKIDLFTFVSYILFLVTT